METKVKMTLRTLLADDHALVRAGLRSLLEEMAGVEVVAEAADGHEALRLIGELKPDVAFLDISMPGLNGLDTAERATREHPRTRVIILSMHVDDEYVRRALVAGAAGYLLKNSDRSELEMALRAVARGETWLTPEVSSRVVAAYARGEMPAASGPLELLTRRQREVLQLIAEGLSTKEIAHRLDVSVKTVESHRTELMDRLDIHGVAGLVRYAIRVGIVHSDN
jgi:DNA-binding NarL/FixJ family response regulator